MKTLRTPLLLFALPATLCAVAAGRAGSLLLTRDAPAAGEVWRLWTGHWVHFSSAHAGWNLLVLLAAGTWLERVRPGLLARFTLAAAPLLSLAVLAFEPELVAYGGLSGLATGVVVLLALDRTAAARAPLPWAGVLVLVAAKSLHDATGAGSWFAGFDGVGVRSSAVAHAAGALLGAAGFAARFIPRRPAMSLEPSKLNGSRGW